MEHAYQVLIVGGGLVGASLAIALDRAGVRTALVEATAEAMPAVFDQRNLSFADATVNALTALGVLQALKAPSGLIRQMMLHNPAQPHPRAAHDVESLAMFYSSIGDGKEGVQAFLEKRKPNYR